MPNPSWLPIVGSGFDSIGSQLQGWAGFNRGVEEGNIGRMDQRDAIQRNYFQNAAQLQAAQEAEAYRRSQIERERADALRSTAERNRIQQSQFATGLALDREKIAAADTENKLRYKFGEARDADKRLAERAQQVYQFASAGKDPATLDPSLTSGLTPEHAATAKGYFDLYNQKQNEARGVEEQHTGIANNIINSERIKKGVKEWMTTPEGASATKKLTPQQQIAAYVAANKIPPLLDDTELATVQTKYKFGNLKVKDSHWDDSKQQYVFPEPSSAPSLDSKYLGPDEPAATPATGPQVWNQPSVSSPYPFGQNTASTPVDFGGVPGLTSSGTSAPTTSLSGPAVKDSGFRSEAEARAAGKRDGDVVIINGRRGELIPD